MTATAREQIRALVDAEPDLTQAQIAERLGISRQRVSQLVQAEGFTVRRGTPGVGQRRLANPPAARVLTGGIPVKISHTVAGTIGELLAAADLMARGYTVFFPMSRTAACDLVALTRDSHPLRIEVRCGNRKGKRLVFAKKDRSTADHYAVIVTGEPVTYRPELPG